MGGVEGLGETFGCGGGRSGGRRGIGSGCIDGALDHRVPLA
jgi:hypothetical protein